MLLTAEFISKQGSSNLTDCPTPPVFQFSDPTEDLQIPDHIDLIYNPLKSPSQILEIKNETVPSSTLNQPTLEISTLCSTEMSADLKKAEDSQPSVSQALTLSPDPILNPSSDVDDDTELIALASNNSSEECESLPTTGRDFCPRRPNPFNRRTKRRGKKNKSH